MTPTPVCPCDAADSTPITNLPGLSQIAYRAGNFNDFRRALLTPLLAAPGQPPLEQSLTAWQSGVGADPSVVDLAVMMVEWWAYLADILTFYNERIANEDYLGTAALPETPAALIKLLGYRPRPAIGATGTLGALVTPSLAAGMGANQKITLPKGLQFQSKPGPGGAPQTFELAAATPIGAPDQVMAVTPPFLVAKYVSRVESSGFHHFLEIREFVSYGILLQGSVKSVSNGSLLMLGARDDTIAATLITLSAPPAVQTVASGGKQTLLTFTDTPPSGLSAENARLSRANQSASLWTVNGSPFTSDTVIELAGLARQVRPNDYVAFTAPGQTPQLIKVTSVADVLGDACSAGGPTSVSTGGSGKPIPIPVLHTELTLATSLSSGLKSSAVAVSVLFGWVEIGTLVDQPPALWDGVSTSLQPVQPGQFVPGASIPILVQDANGTGEAGAGDATTTSLSATWPAATTTPFSPGLQPPVSVFYNLLPVTEGKTVANEIVGSGDATVPGQSFILAKSPVTYLTKGSSYASTIALTVNGQPCTEVPSFYGQAANARVFVTREDAQQNTHIAFGDGVNGARLPTGTNNVVATYRVGAGAALPPAGKLTVIAQAYPGLQAVVNPVAVSGGSDADPASLIRQYAPRSVLTFGRAVSVFDYQALAAQAPGVSMAQAVWSWDEMNQWAGVTVYVAGQSGVATSVQALLNAAGDPNRPVRVLTATAITVTLTLALIVTPGMDPNAITANVSTALCDPLAGLFSPVGIGIGQGLFDSNIEEVVLAVSGVIAIASSQFAANGLVDANPLHLPGEGSFFSLVQSDLDLSTEGPGGD
jgi:hypothetical protein